MQPRHPPAWLHTILFVAACFLCEALRDRIADSGSKHDARACYLSLYVAAGVVEDRLPACAPLLERMRDCQKEDSISLFTTISV
jgi:hypothetical protein